MIDGKTPHDNRQSTIEPRHSQITNKLAIPTDGINEIFTRRNDDTERQNNENNLTK